MPIFLARKVSITVRDTSVLVSVGCISGEVEDFFSITNKGRLLFDYFVKSLQWGCIRMLT